ncbi:MAG TPA: LysR family transcriptional regulator [Pseudonocardiaceae bacterium]|nr:LysR family transcriptional regulator [Pseudonocardiaceae bacterium]
MLDVHRLRLLRELAQHGTIAATARVCSLTPSAVSQQLSLLQREVGTPLLVRDGRGVLLTEAGRTLVAHTERILAELEEAGASIAALSESVSGVVRLAAFPTAASSLVPAAIAATRAAHPEVKVLLEEAETAEGVAALKAGRLDLLIVYEYNLLPDITDAGIELTPLVTESLLAAVPTGVRLPRGRLRLDVLRDQPWIAPRSDTALRAILERACGLAGFAPQVDYTSDDYTVILALVAAGLGVSLVPPLATETVSATLRLRPVADPTLSRRVSVAARAGSTRTPRIAVLIRNLRHAAAELRVPTA